MPFKEGLFEPARPIPLRSQISIQSILIALTVISVLYTSLTSSFLSSSSSSRIQNVPINAQQILERCRSLHVTPQTYLPWPGRRKESDRYEPGTNATYIKNAIIYTGEHGDNSVIHGSIYLDRGIIKHIGNVPPELLEDRNMQVIDAKGNWVTPGLVDLHSHIGLQSLPLTEGANDLNSPHGPIVPWLRSIDAFKTHDDAFRLAMAGGVTSAQILPGSANAMGGQAFMVKLRKTSKGTPFSMTIEPPHGLVGSNGVADNTRWRYLMQTCGENVRRYGNRMDNTWALREAFNKAREVAFTQEQYCAHAEAGLWDNIRDPFPDDFKYEVLVDVLRGRVKMFSHCEEVVDLDSIVRLSNEFKFPIASFHHASEAWLAPELLKGSYGDKYTPGAALFATNHRYRRESFRGSEYAPRVLADAGIPVVMKSDHPTIDSRYLIHEAQQAHYFGLAPNTSLASVTSTPAEIAGLSHRIGVLREGTDADVVLWDSHPLQIGATPLNVWIDGIMQIPVPMKNGQPTPVVIGEGKEGDQWRQVPEVPNWDKERNEALRWDGLPPLRGKPRKESILFTNVTSIWSRNSGASFQRTFSSQQAGKQGSVLVKSGRIVCSGAECPTSLQGVELMNLRGGSIAPGLMTFGSPLGLEEIAHEPSTGDGPHYDAFAADIPEILGDTGGILRAMDGLAFGTRNALTAYQAGVTFATSYLGAPFNIGGEKGPVIAGLSATFRTGAAHAVQRGAIIQDIAALHIKIVRLQPMASRGVSVSTQIAGLRRLLSGWENRETETGQWFKKAAEGVIPLVIEVESADIMASLLLLKAEVEDGIGSRMRMVFSGAAEAHLLAEEIGKSGVGVILNPIRGSPLTWSERRILPGPPLSNDTALVKLMESGITVGIGVPEAWQARNTRFDIRWAALESNGRIDEYDMYALAHSNLQTLLGIRGLEDDDLVDLVVYEGGGAFDMGSKAVGVIAPQRGVVDLF